MPFRFTPAMQKRLSRRLVQMLHHALHHFPELQGQTITVGYTRVHLGAAIREQNLIRLRARKVSYNTIGHELTHLVQGQNGIPGGEKQCDIWTLARSPLFCDEAPAYLRLPAVVRQHWPAFAPAVRALCLRALEIRKTHRQYIRWLEQELHALSRCRAASATGQLSLFETAGREKPEA
ncbi:MAG: hypothetical protein ONB48_14255 [candidate division KSB1 bacterium]|nr:hypothetical protein [candidate division KSB1 bacterium]MDZ7273600.1 hypothetical protein [candidate division KSB1 bacterium]MDZ7286809.1 hypothetical protein [candidate division KSB1 bacterium]MDZ7299834.1 hypothetical protein [candidate division KSB1 bacterium]MDZ7307747.1 hypothetical protein [candidate division KSB1 bacterium]